MIHSTPAFVILLIAALALVGYAAVDTRGKIGLIGWAVLLTIVALVFFHWTI